MKHDAFLTPIEIGQRDSLAGQIAVLAARLSHLRYEYNKINKRAYDRARYEYTKVDI